MTGADIANNPTTKNEAEPSGSTAVIIQARIGSTRLPGKVLLPLAGKPALERLIERVKWANLVDQVIVATTTETEDQAIEESAERLGCLVCRRPEPEDVFSRVLEAARAHEIETIVEVTADCPLIDPAHIDHLIRLYRLNAGQAQAQVYVSNVLTRTWPDGFDLQVYDRAALERIDAVVRGPHRSHVGWNITQHPERGPWLLVNWSAPPEMFWPDLGLTLDEPADLTLLDRIFREIFPWDASAEQVIALLRRKPHLAAINKFIRRKTPGEG